MVMTWDALCIRSMFLPPISLALHDVASILQGLVLERQTLCSALQCSALDPESEEHRASDLPVGVLSGKLPGDPVLGLTVMSVLQLHTVHAVVCQYPWL